MKKTETEKELENLCQKIVEEHQLQFDKLLKEEESEYDTFMKYSELTSSLHLQLELATTHFTPKVSNYLEIRYARLKQLSIGLERYTEFVRANNRKFDRKFVKPNE